MTQLENNLPLSDEDVILISKIFLFCVKRRKSVSTAAYGQQILLLLFNHSHWQTILVLEAQFWTFQR